MADWTFNPEIADAIKAGRLLPTLTARGVAERQMGSLSDKLWEEIRAKWEWHFAMSDIELENGGRRPAIGSEDPTSSLA